MKVLIVDDMQAICKKFVRILSKCEDMEVVGFALSGYEAMSKVSEFRPDIILMDIEMETPLAGLMTSREIYRLYPQTKIIILTVHNEESTVLSAFQNGVVNYLLKDSGDNDIIHAVRNAYQDNNELKGFTSSYLKKEVKRLRDKEASMMQVLNMVLQLTPTELEIMKLYHMGYPQKEIREMKLIEKSTMKSHITHILRKFNCDSLSEAAAMVEEAGLFAIIN